MLEEYKRNVSLDREIIFLAADPYFRGKGTGTFLLEELKRRVKNKRIYLFTDNACTYQFYKKRGFEGKSGKNSSTFYKNLRFNLEIAVFLFYPIFK